MYSDAQKRGWLAALALDGRDCHRMGPHPVSAALLELHFLRTNDTAQQHPPLPRPPSLRRHLPRLGPDLPPTTGRAPPRTIPDNIDLKVASGNQQRFHARQASASIPRRSHPRQTNSEARPRLAIPMARIYDDHWIHVPVQRLDGLRGVPQTPQLSGLGIRAGRQPWQVRGARAGRKSEDALVRARPCRFVALLGRVNCPLCRETARSRHRRHGIRGICLARRNACGLLWPPTPPLQRPHAPRPTRKALERANRRDRISQEAR